MDVIKENITRHRFTTRIITSICLLLLILPAIYFGGKLFLFCALLALILSVKEWLLMIAPKNQMLEICLLTAGLLAILYAYQSEGLAFAFVAFIFLLIGINVICLSTKSALFRVGFGVFYFGALTLSLLYLFLQEANMLVIFYLLSCVWVADSFALMGGLMFGGKKLAPSISPNKTWSGFGVSLFFTAICSVVFMKELLWGFVLGLAIGLVTQMGDLFISAVKRFYDVKDTGKILPAHGGLLDRLDGAIAVIILAALFLLISGVGFSPLSPYFNVFLLGFFNG